MAPNAEKADGSAGATEATAAAIMTIRNMANLDGYGVEEVLDLFAKAGDYTSSRSRARPTTKTPRRSHT